MQQSYPNDKDGAGLNELVKAGWFCLASHKAVPEYAFLRTVRTEFESKKPPGGTFSQ